MSQFLASRFTRIQRVVLLLPSSCPKSLSFGCDCDFITRINQITRNRFAARPVPAISDSEGDFLTRCHGISLNHWRFTSIILKSLFLVWIRQFHELLKTSQQDTSSLTHPELEILFSSPLSRTKKAFLDFFSPSTKECEDLRCASAADVVSTQKKKITSHGSFDQMKKSFSSLLRWLMGFLAVTHRKTWALRRKWKRRWTLEWKQSQFAFSFELLSKVLNFKTFILLGKLEANTAWSKTNAICSFPRALLNLTVNSGNKFTTLNVTPI